MSKGYFIFCCALGIPKRCMHFWFQWLWLIDLSIKFTQILISKRFLFCFFDTSLNEKNTHLFRKTSKQELQALVFLEKAHQDGQETICEMPWLFF